MALIVSLAHGLGNLASIVSASELTLSRGSGIIGVAFSNRTALNFGLVVRESKMADHPQEQNNNPLDDLADDLSVAGVAKNVDVHNASVDKVQGGRVSMAKSAARLIEASAMDMADSAAVFVRADSLEMRDCATVAVVSKKATLQESNASVMVSASVKAQDSMIGLLVAGRVEGNVKAVLTPLAALAFGAGVGVTMTLLQEIIRRMRRARS
jgi:hypothetical protein